MYVRDGDLVRTGQSLAKLDTSVIDLQVKAAQAALTSARSRYVADRDETTKDLPDAVRNATLDADRAAIAAAQASLAQARETLRDVTLTAPIGGTVTEVGLETGQRVTGATVCRGTGSRRGSAGRSRSRTWHACGCGPKRRKSTSPSSRSGRARP